ncbi:hypothetical protein HID58_065783 [Brassica napus]|uniref:Uncharacterized protein n=1 Tax=Brassica napus TaxID=3708 RepID=A0ABQ7ZDT8_BRANA|nr:hypothetical protein HID58_065783 [Brassica napus]
MSTMPQSKGARRRHIWYTTILSTIGEARARAWQVATPPVAIGQGMYISVFCAREPETGRILAFKKARFDNFEADSVRGSKRLMQDVDACVRKLKVEALALARKEFVHTSNGFVLCRKSNKVEKDHEKSYIWWLMVKRVL